MALIGTGLPVREGWVIELYHNWDSFCSFKVRLALEEKGLTWTDRHIDLMTFENLDPGYLEVNPHGLVPTLFDDGDPIFESTFINEYLDDKFPEAPLRPADPKDRARMRYWVKHEEDELFAAVRPASLNLMMKQVYDRYTDEELDRYLAHHPRPYLIGRLKAMFRAPFDADAVAKSSTKLRAAFAKMNATLAPGGWLAGTTYSLADIAAAPVIDRVARLGMSDLWEGLQDLEDWIERLSARPAYAAAKPRDAFRLPPARVPGEA